MTLAVQHEALSDSHEADRRVLEELGHITIVDPTDIAAVDGEELPSIAGADLVEGIAHVGKNVDTTHLDAERQRRLKKIQDTLRDMPYPDY